MTESNHSTATVTLNSVKYAPEPNGDSLTELAVVSLTLKNTSSKPFAFNDDAILVQYGTLANFVSGPTNGDGWGADMTADYTPFGDPLRNGELAPGESKTGLAIYEMSRNASYILQFDDPASNGGKPLAFWSLKSAK
ncbi:hypothetical protein ACRAWC_01605 [Leifsonia sp. L25]|uniref:hypothetical protein n=1 Tax=Leifsonia sp. L25 TaxID=3423957 RepID=UPI003D69E1A1